MVTVLISAVVGSIKKASPGFSDHEKRGVRTAMAGRQKGNTVAPQAKHTPSGRRLSRAEREARVLAVMGKCAYVKTSSEGFARRKQIEIENER